MMPGKQMLGPCLVAVAALALLVGCSAPAAPQAPAPTTAAKPAAAPVKKVDFPIKGKAITIIVSAQAGGAVDAGARLLAPLLEADLGTPVEVVNKPGAGWQVGLTELALAKPDGYTFGYTPLPNMITLEKDPERKTAFTRKSFQPLAMHVMDPAVVAVKADSPFKSMKDLIDAAKAKPGQIKNIGGGILGDDHLVTLQLEKITGTKFSVVHFDGVPSMWAAVLGGHVDVYVGNTGDTIPQVKGGQARALGIADKQENENLPGVKTMEAQGIPLVTSVGRGISAPAGVPKEIVDILTGSIKKAMESEEHKRKMKEAAMPLRYLGPAEMESIWVEMENTIVPLMALAR